jgi:hypothetical protein
VVSTGFIWLRPGTSGGLLWTRYWTFGFHKMLGSSWVAAQLAASPEGLSSITLSNVYYMLQVLYLSMDNLITIVTNGDYIHEYIKWRIRHERILTTSQFRILLLTTCTQTPWLKLRSYNFTFVFCETWSPSQGKNIDWGCLGTRSSGECFNLRDIKKVKLFLCLIH